MLFGAPIKYKIQFFNEEGKNVSLILDAINQDEAVNVAKTNKVLNFKTLISVKEYCGCAGCK